MIERELVDNSRSTSQRDLSMRLQRLSDRLRYDLERPTSPFPKKDKLINYVNSLATIYIQDKEDVEILQRLIMKEDEFVMAAFDLFESDKDQENLLDTLIRIVRKHKKAMLPLKQDASFGPGSATIYGDPFVQSEDNTRYFTGSFGNVGMTHAPTSFNKTQSDETSSDEDSDEDSEEDYREEFGQKNVSHFNQPVGQYYQREDVFNQPVRDRVTTAHRKTRGGNFGRRQQPVQPQLQPEDVYDMLVNNSHLNNELDNETRGFVLYLANIGDKELTNYCKEYMDTNNIKEFVSSVDNYANGFAQNYYDQEFNESQLESLQEKNSNDELDTIFERFSRTGNLTLFKNQLLDVIKPLKKVKSNTILGSLQAATKGNVITPGQYGVLSNYGVPAQRQPRQSISEILNKIESLETLNPSERKHIKELIQSRNEKLLTVAEVYQNMNDWEDLKESVQILLRCTFKDVPKTRAPTGKPAKITESFESMIKKMERQGELNGIEKNRLLSLYRDEDERIMGIWDSYRYDGDLTEFNESIFLFSSAIALNAQSSRNIERRRSYRKHRSSKELSGLIVPKQMSMTSEEFEEEEEEEEEEDEQAPYWDDEGPQSHRQEGGDNVNDEDVKNTFIEQQHRIIRRFCLNAKIPIADGAKFHQMINDCHPKIISSFEVFALNRNEEDFLENLMVIADIMKHPTEGESPDGKNMSALNGFSGSPNRFEDEQEKKLIFDLEPMERVESEGEEDEDDDQHHPAQNPGVMNGVIEPPASRVVPYAPAEIEEYVRLLDDFRDEFSDEEVAALTQTLKAHGEQAKRMVVSALECYHHVKDKAEAADTLRLLLQRLKH